MHLPASVTIVEVSLRDGLQDEHTTLSTADKAGLCRALVGAGLRHIEATSFVRPDLVPQLADAEELARLILPASDIVYAALIPNLKGAERALQSGFRTWHLLVSASETHNWVNIHRTVDQSLDELGRVAALAAQAGVTLAGYIGTAFGCPFEGQISIAKVGRLVDAYAGMGVNHITLADTTGMANPRQVYETAVSLQEAYPAVVFGMHFHNTRDLGLANVLAAMQAGVTRFDASLGGIGGCPFAPAAGGNIATEDLVHMLSEMGIDTGIDLDQLIDASRRLESLLGHALASRLPKVGKAYDLHDPSEIR